MHQHQSEYLAHRIIALEPRSPSPDSPPSGAEGVKIVSVEGLGWGCSVEGRRGAGLTSAATDRQKLVYYILLRSPSQPLI